MKGLLHHVLLPLTLLVGTICSAETTFTAGNLSYTILSEDDATVSVKGTASTSGDIIIPGEVEYNSKKYTVTKIASQGFSENNNITSVVVPATINTMGGGAFYKCTNLTNIAIHPASNITTINNEFVSGCSKLETITLSSHVSTIKTEAFKGCGKLKTIIVTSNAAPTSISSTAFSGITLSNITLKVLSSNAETSFGGADYFKEMNVVVTPLTISDAADNSETLAMYDGLVADVVVSRKLNSGGYNSLCLPFDMSAEQISTLWSTCDIQVLSSASVSESELVLNFSAVSSIEAGVPYLVQPTATIDGFTIQNATLSAATHSVSDGGVSFIGVYNPTMLAASDDIAFVSGGNTLTPSAGGEIGGLRAYFDISGVPASAHSHARLSFNGTPTAVSTESSSADTYTKRFEHGVLIIERNGVRYSIMGERL